MTRPTVFMYSGQGSQYFHMTAELYERHPRYRLWLDHCDEIASPILGKSLLDTVFDPGRQKSDPFDSLADSNAALLCVEYSLTRVVQELGYRPDALLGYSLGEITAAVVAEVFPLELGISFAVDFARLLAERTPRAGMLAIVGPPELLLTHQSLFAGCWVTGRNFDGNFVVSGHAARIDALQAALRHEGVLCERLPVNWGVHTELIDPVEAEVRGLLGGLDFAPPQIPIVSATAAGLVDAVTADGIWAAMRNPVEFSRTVGKMTAETDATFIDLGPSATLATFVKYLLPPGSGSVQTSTINRFGNNLKSMSDFQEQTASIRG
ncbi:acyltransferase domain-containing protein [Kitasatospora sp. NBC_00240]|uniref:acyltransferase domain-containing protein n=1 Tax=Kitasatospora sp. NBC_00240 TaxID=2903567 RepID=UPI00225ACFDA|nr:acyltransferase domain-containing protein [Kitasatospora sp. NBC_00240]MCX5214365.1 acyltransferase domain-containing protein [Kitasatospora sp. NBC_00240]